MAGAPVLMASPCLSTSAHTAQHYPESLLLSVPGSFAPQTEASLSHSLRISHAAEGSGKTAYGSTYERNQLLSWILNRTND
jgi:hypothetical protein